jgi:Zn-dependent alcohol dehydrogenase
MRLQLGGRARERAGAARQPRIGLPHSEGVEDMSRRRRPEKRIILPDPKYGDHVLSKFMTNLMYDGMKSVAEGIVYGALETMQTRAKADPVQLFHDALNNVGTLALAGVGFGDLTLNMLSMISGRTITGVMEGDSVPHEFIPKLAKLNADGLFPFDDLITIFPIEQINEAEAASASGTVIKPVLTFDSLSS